MLTYTLKKTPGHPLYEQLYQNIRDDIAAGRLPAGSRLPSKRVLAAHLGVSVVTVESAYAQLLAEGYAEARPRSGVYVCAIGSSVPVQPPHMPSLPQPSAPEPLFDLSGGTGEDVPFPASVWVRTMREVIADKRLMQPVDFAGAPESRRVREYEITVSDGKAPGAVSNRTGSCSHHPQTSKAPVRCTGASARYSEEDQP